MKCKYRSYNSRKLGFWGVQIYRLYKAGGGGASRKDPWNYLNFLSVFESRKPVLNYLFDLQANLFELVYSHKLYFEAEIRYLKRSTDFVN